MVDPDRLDDVMSSSSSSKKKKKKKKSNKSKSSGSEDAGMTKSEKLEHLKGSSSSSSPSTSASGDTEDIKRLLFALANMDGYPRIVAEYDFDQFNKAQSKIKEEFAKDVSGEVTNFLGVFGVDEVADKYGYGWGNILDIVMSNQDMTGRTLRTNSGNVSKGDVKELLDAIANIILYVEGSLRSKQDMDNKKQRDATIEVVAENIYEQYKTILSRNEVQNISERHGYDWQNDILKGVLTEQDFESKLKSKQ